MRFDQILRPENKLIFWSCTFICFMAVSSFASAKVNTSTAKVRYFRGYKEIEIENGRLLIERKPATYSDRTISFVKNSRQLLITRDKDKVVLEMTSRHGDRFFTTSLKFTNDGIAKIGVIPFKKALQFNGSVGPCEKRGLESSLEKLTNKDFLSKISSSASDNFLDSSCDEMPEFEKMDFADSIARELNPETAFLVKCLNREDVQAELNKKPNLKKISTQTLSMYLSEMEDIAEGKGKLKFGCFPADSKSNASAMFENSTPAVRFPLNNGKFVPNSCKGIDQLISHELVHAAGAADPIPYQLDTLCAKSMGIAVASDEKCVKEYPDIQDSQGVEVAQAIKNTNAAVDKKVQKEVQAVLQSEVKPESFVEVASSDLEMIASSSQTSSPQYTSSLNRVYGAMVTNMERLAAPLNSAVSAAVPEARAAEVVNPRTSSAPESRNAIRKPSSVNGNNKLQEYTVEEIVLDKFSSPLGRDTTPMTEREPQGQISSSRQRQNSLDSRNEVASAEAPQGGSVVHDSPKSEVNSRRSQVRLPANDMSASVTPLEQGLTNQLATSSKIVGQAYRDVTNRYGDKNFDNELKTNGISIQTGARTIGASGKNIKVKFIDSGASLEKQDNLSP